MIDRTEEDALAGKLPIYVGGERVELRTLNLDESDEWLAKFGAAVAAFDLPGGLNGQETFELLARTPSRTMLDLVLEYDVDAKLGDVTALRKRLSQRELYEALKTMVIAENPFVSDVRSALAAYGPQIWADVLGILALALRRFQPANSTSSLSPNGDSTPTLSVIDSHKSDSSSSGATARSGSRGRAASRR